MKTIYRLTITQRKNGQAWGEDVILDFGSRADAWRAVCDLDIGEYANHNTVFQFKKVNINEENDNAAGDGDGGQTE